MSIDAHIYENVLDESQVHVLRQQAIETDQLNQNIGSTYWLDKNDKPNSAIEKYILSTYQKVIADSSIDESEVVGFEWWIQFAKGGSHFPIHFHIYVHQYSFSVKITN